MVEFPAGFFDRMDESPDAAFYAFDRFVTHIDDEAIAAVGELYHGLGLTGHVLDLCSSWISHFERQPTRLVALGMNAAELAANQQATEVLVHDLNADPAVPFDDATFDAVTCCVSVDYLTRPVEVFVDVARVLRPGGVFVLTFSNRCFPTKVIRGWLSTDDRGHCAIVAAYFAAANARSPSGPLYGAPTAELRNPGAQGDPVYAVWARRSGVLAPMPVAFVIRPATERDQAFVSEMQYEAFFVAPGAEPFPRSILEEASIRPYHEAFGTRPGDVGRVAEGPGGELLGAAWVRQVQGYGFVDHDTPELGIAVVPHARGRGVGTALLRDLLVGVPRCSLSVDDRNPATRLYERLGFRLVRRDGEHSIVMLRDGKAA